MTETVDEIIARAVMENDVCGYTLNESERVFCDDLRLGTEQDAYQKPLRQERCGCRAAANAVREALASAGFAIVPVEPTKTKGTIPNCNLCGKPLVKGFGKDAGAWICYSCHVGQIESVSPATLRDGQS